MARKYLAVTYPGSNKPFTFHDEFDLGAKIGDQCEVVSRGRKAIVTVAAIDQAEPPFITKQIDKVLPKGGAA